MSLLCHTDCSCQRGENQTLRDYRPRRQGAWPPLAGRVDVREGGQANGRPNVPHMDGKASRNPEDSRMTPTGGWKDCCRRTRFCWSQIGEWKTSKQDPPPAERPTHAKVKKHGKAWGLRKREINPGFRFECT